MNELFCFVILVLLSFVNSGNVVKQISPKDVPHSSESTSVKVQGRIVNGNQAEPNQFPYQVSIRSVTGSSASICGGSVLTTTYILTAAHCTRGYSRFDIGIGSIFLNMPLQKITSKVKIEHPDFNPVSLTNDISLIKLPTPIVYNENVQPIKLPKLSQVSGNFLNQHGVVSGFGRLTDSSTHVSQTLHFVDMRIIANSECAGIFGSRIANSHVICAKGADKGSNQNACLGDSGGPLTIDDNGVTVQIGLVSFVSSRGCSYGDPSGYTRVAKYLHWISKVTGISLEK